MLSQPFQLLRKIDLGTWALKAEQSTRSQPSIDPLGGHHLRLSILQLPLLPVDLVTDIPSHVDFSGAAEEVAKKIVKLSKDARD